MTPRERPASHALRAVRSFSAHNGTAYAAAITYFTLLSVVPAAMLACAAGGVVLAGDHELLGQVQALLRAQLPPELQSHAIRLVDSAISGRTAVGLTGLAAAVYSGIGWMRHLRDALTLQWGDQPGHRSVLRTAGYDLAALSGLGVALALSCAITFAVAKFGAVLTVLALFANWGIFAVVLAKLPRNPLPVRQVRGGAAIMAIGFEALKHGTGLLLARTADSPTGLVFGPVIGFVAFAHLTAQLLLFSAAWGATSGHPLGSTASD